MGGMRRRSPVWFVAGVVLALAAVAASAAGLAAYHRGYQTERALRAGAEPVLAGLFTAAPWIALVAADLFALLLLGVWRSVSRGGRARAPR